MSQHRQRLLAQHLPAVGSAVTVATTAALILSAGLLPATAGAAARPTTATAPAATTPAWSLVGTVDPLHIIAGNTQMVLYGVQGLNSFYAGFDPRVIPASVQQVVVPYVRIPDGRSHTYKLAFHLSTAGTTTTHYQLDTRTPVAIAPGDTTLEFTDTTPATSTPTIPQWYTWSLGNLDKNIWLFYSCSIYEETS
jgi:hypothetical protein